MQSSVCGCFMPAAFSNAQAVYALLLFPNVTYHPNLRFACLFGRSAAVLHLECCDPVAVLHNLCKGINKTTTNISPHCAPATP
jgi:hypothetical protein